MKKNLEKSTLLQGVSHVNPGRWQDQEREQMMTAISGQKWLPLLKTYNLNGSLEKMCEALLMSHWDCKGHSLTWKVLAIKPSHILFQLQGSVLSTEENESGLLLIQEGMVNQSLQENQENLNNPNKSHSSEMWPTPTTQEIEHPQAELTENGRRKSKDGNSSHSLNLADSVKVWPTPRARDYKDGKKVPPSVGKTRSHTLATKVIEENQKVMWPTPTTKGYGHASEGQTLMLRKMVEEGVLTELEAEQMMNGTTLRPPRMVKWNFPTPTARDHLMPRKPETMAKTGRNPETNSLPDAIQHLEMFPTPTANEDAAGKAGGNMQKMLGNDPKVRNTGEGTLASEWVELLMGYPKGWTDLKNQNASLKNVRVIWDENWEKDTPRVAVGQKDRMKRLKGLGNAIVPQIAEMIGKAIMESENDI